MGTREAKSLPAATAIPRTEDPSRPGCNDAEMAIDEVDDHCRRWPADRTRRGRKPPPPPPCPSTISRRPQGPSSCQREPIGRRDEVNSDQRLHGTDSPPRSAPIARLANPATRGDEITEITLGKRHERTPGEAAAQPDGFPPVLGIHGTCRQQNCGCASEERCRQASAQTHC